MATLKVTIPKIRCRKTTIELGKDEIYFLLLVTGAKLDANGEAVAIDAEGALYGKVSEVKKGVKKETVWRPKLNDISIDIADAENLSVTLALYEKDNGKIHQELAEKADGVIVPDGPEWPSKLVGDVMDGLPSDQAAWIAFAWKAVKYVKSLITHFRKDDLIDYKQILTATNDTGFAFPRELRMEGHSGSYDVTVQFALED